MIQEMFFTLKRKLFHRNINTRQVWELCIKMNAVTGVQSSKAKNEQLVTDCLYSTFYLFLKAEP